MAKITENSDELSFHSLASQSMILTIPIFQRSYIWSKKQLDRMTRELDSIVDERDQSRFLGAIVAVTRPTNPSQPTPYEIVDGQQRLTTLYLFLLGAAQLAAREGKSDIARGIIGTNLIIDWAQEAQSNTKLLPSMGDRNQLREIFDIVSRTGDLEDWLPVKARLAIGTGPKDGALLKQFRNIQKYLRGKFASGGFPLIEKLIDAARNKMTFVFILLRDPGSATTVFEGLNDPGVPIAIGDLVKNEVFARKEYNANEAQAVHDQKWIPFREKFGDHFNDYFFPYCVIMRSNTSRTDMFDALRSTWGDLDSKQIIRNLDEYSQSFLALVGHRDSIEKYGKSVAPTLQRLFFLKQPSSTFPFEMRMLKALERREIGVQDVVGSLEVIESFLVRRAVCGIEPTGLLGMFRTMWSATEGHPNADRVASVITKRLTVEWPSDQRLTEAIKTRPIYGSSVARYVVLEYDKSLGSDHPPADAGTIEHIMPASWSEDWSDVVSKPTHVKIKDLWGNLIPLTEKMNQSVAQAKFSEKKKILGRDSIFISARIIGSEHNKWDEYDIMERSDLLSNWAIKRWPKN